jgi:hypothetical protein
VERERLASVRETSHTGSHQGGPPGWLPPIEAGTHARPTSPRHVTLFVLHRELRVPRVHGIERATGGDFADSYRVAALRIVSSLFLRASRSYDKTKPLADRTNCWTGHADPAVFATCRRFKDYGPDWLGTKIFVILNFDY